MSDAVTSSLPLSDDAKAVIERTIDSEANALTQISDVEAFYEVERTADLIHLNGFKHVRNEPTTEKNYD